MQVHKPFRWLQPSLADFVTHHGTQPVCDFVGAARSSVERWTANSNPAQGTLEIRLWHFVLAAGYEIPELRIPQFNQYLAELYAYSVITIDEAKQLSGVKNNQDVLQILRGREPMQPAVGVEGLEEMYGESLQYAKSGLQDKLRAFSPSALPPLPEATPEVLAEAPAFDVLVPVLAAMVKGVSPLALLALESWTPAQRSRLRELAGEELFELANSLFNLSQVLNALNSERARAQHREGR